MTGGIYIRGLVCLVCHSDEQFLSEEESCFQKKVVSGEKRQKQDFSLRFELLT
jgi:hypothetical protein